MKRSGFAGLLFCAAILFFLTSCGGNENKEQTNTDANSATAASPSNAVIPETNTIITTPQNMMIAIHRVSDFAKWKASYDEHDSMRLANGLHSYVIGRGFNDTNMVLVAVKAEDLSLIHI